MVADRAYPADLEVAARVRVDSWSGGDAARAGLSLAQDADGAGYNLLFRDGGVQFLDDHVAWGPLVPVRLAGGHLVPLQAAVDRRGAVRQGLGGRRGRAVGLDVRAVGLAGPVGGSPGLNGGSGGSTASFDDFLVSAVNGTALPPPRRA